MKIKLSLLTLMLFSAHAIDAAQAAGPDIIPLTQEQITELATILEQEETVDTKAIQRFKETGDVSSDLYWVTYLCDLEKEKASDELICAVIQAGGKIHQKEDNLTTLHLAAIKNRYTVLNLLIDRGVDVEAKAENGITVLHVLLSSPGYFPCPEKCFLIDKLLQKSKKLANLPMGPGAMFIGNLLGMDRTAPLDLMINECFTANASLEGFYKTVQTLLKYDGKPIYSLDHLGEDYNELVPRLLNHGNINLAKLFAAYGFAAPDKFKLSVITQAALVAAFPQKYSQEEKELALQTLHHCRIPKKLRLRDPLSLRESAAVAIFRNSKTQKQLITALNPELVQQESQASPTIALPSAAIIATALTPICSIQ